MRRTKRSLCAWTMLSMSSPWRRRAPMGSSPSSVAASSPEVATRPSKAPSTDRRDLWWCASAEDWASRSRSSLLTRSFLSPSRFSAFSRAILSRADSASDCCNARFVETALFSTRLSRARSTFSMDDVSSGFAASSTASDTPLPLPPDTPLAGVPRAASDSVEPRGTLAPDRALSAPAGSSSSKLNSSCCSVRSCRRSSPTSAVDGRAPSSAAKEAFAALRDSISSRRRASVSARRELRSSALLSLATASLFSFAFALRSSSTSESRCWSRAWSAPAWDGRPPWGEAGVDSPESPRSPATPSTAAIASKRARSMWFSLSRLPHTASCFSELSDKIRISAWKAAAASSAWRLTSNIFAWARSAWFLASFSASSALWSLRSTPTSRSSASSTRFLNSSSMSVRLVSASSATRWSICSSSSSISSCSLRIVMS
mmetsp:Transcript_20816/g.60846  ORF Transcript_20816/g.60846 Transcript_20816/m.60846 type:complete len:430 (-) Transcript_20816:483-1772(-)